MSFQFDATLKDIYSPDPADLAPILHLPTDLPAHTLNVDLSTISAATDVAYGFGDPVEEIADINFQSGPDPHVDERMLLYSAVYRHRFHVSVRSILILLRPAADHPSLTGQLIYTTGDCRVEFHYETIRLWQQPVALFLTGGLGLLPLAPLCQLPDDVPAEEALREIVRQIDQRLTAEAPHALAMQLMTAAFILAGLRLPKESLHDVFRGVKVMHESSAFDLYEEIGMQKGLEKGMQKGRVEACHRLLLRLGRNFFGPPDSETEAALRAIKDLDRLERMADTLRTAQDWAEFLATP